MCCANLQRLVLSLMLCAVWVHVEAASLWTAKTIADGTPYSDKLARKKGDLLTIRVRETTSASEEQKTGHSRDTDNSFSGTITPVSAASRSTPGIGLNSSRDFEGEGKVESSNDVRATVTARVMSVLDNGNLVIEGRRSIKINADTKVILISGIIRPADITAENTVLSERMHNFRVGIEGEGPLTEAQQQGIFSRLLGFLWPF